MFECVGEWCPLNPRKQSHTLAIVAKTLEKREEWSMSVGRRLRGWRTCLPGCVRDGAVHHNLEKTGSEVGISVDLRKDTDTHNMWTQLG